MTQQKQTKISVRLEGGLGDCLLATRFIPAIREKYPHAYIKAYCDTNGKTFQMDALRYAYGYLYDEIVTIPSKKYSEFWVDCQFGEDNYYGALENIPDDVFEDMTKNCDKFYDLHIDGLKWMNYDFDAMRYFYFFPKPRTFGMSYLPPADEYVIMHLSSATSKGHILEDFYIEGLVKKVSEFTHVVIIATEENKHLYNFADNPKVSLLISDVETIFQAIRHASAMISVDSGFRYIAYGCNVPVITFSANCYAPGQVPLSHQMRWLMFTSQVLPLNYSFTMVAKSVKNMLTNKGYGLVPFVEDFDKQMVNRKYTINTKKTK